MLKELREFLFKGNLFEVAIGLLLALALQKVIDGLMDFVINPIVAAIAGQPDFSDVLILDLNGSALRFGAFLTVLVGFVIYGTVLFFLLRAYNNGAKRLGMIEDPPPAGPTSEELLAQIRDELRAQRGAGSGGAAGPSTPPV